MNMRIYGTVSMAALVSASAAIAGSVETPVAVLAPIVAPLVGSDFNGFYAGASVTSTSTDINFQPGEANNDPIVGSASGIGGEIHVGYNFAPTDGFFYGGELSYGFPGVSVTEDSTTFSLNSILSANARVGFVSGSLMYYGLAGYAMSNSAAELNGCSVCDVEISHSGYVVGAGIEYLISSNLSVRGQYAYYDFGDTASQYNFGGGEQYESNTSLSASVLSVGLNYHF